MRVLCIGDVIGRPGRRVLRELLPKIQKDHTIDFTIANGENLAGGFGIIPEKFHEITEFHVDVITTGNHIWDRKEIAPFLDHTDRLLRPLNYPPGAPGRGFTACLQWNPAMRPLPRGDEVGRRTEDAPRQEAQTIYHRVRQARTFVPLRVLQSRHRRKQGSTFPSVFSGPAAHPVRVREDTGNV